MRAEGRERILGKGLKALITKERERDYEQGKLSQTRQQPSLPRIKLLESPAPFEGEPLPARPAWKRGR